MDDPPATAGTPARQALDAFARPAVPDQVGGGERRGRGPFDKQRGGHQQQADAGHARGGGERGTWGQALAEQSGGQQRDQQRLHGADGRGHPAGQSVGGDEQQREERADVQRAEHQ